MTMKPFGIKEKNHIFLPAVFAVAILSVSTPIVAHEAPDAVNCATAEGDLRAIAAEKKHAQDQQLESITAIIPAGALLGLATGTENKKLEMLSGDYVEKLDERSAKIKATCGLN